MESFDSLFGDVVFGNQEDFDQNTDSEIEPLWSYLRSPEVPDNTVTSSFSEQEGEIPEELSSFIDDILVDQETFIGNQDDAITSTDGAVDFMEQIIITSNDPSDGVIINDPMEVPISNNPIVEALNKFSVTDASDMIGAFLSSVRHPIPLSELYPISPIVQSPPSFDDLSLLSPASPQTNTNVSPILPHIPVNIPPTTTQISINVLPPSSQTSVNPQIFYVTIPPEYVPSTSVDTGYSEMRKNNNKSCKEYRVRKRNKLQDLEKEKERLEFRNRELKMELKFQERYVKMFKAMVLKKVKPKHPTNGKNLAELLLEAGLEDHVTNTEFCPGCVVGDCSRTDCPNKVEEN